MPAVISMSDQPLAALLMKFLRPPATINEDGQGNTTFTFEPPLSVAEQASLDDLRLMAKFGVTSSITLAEFQAIKPDLVTARAFVGIASPTAAQSNAALKSTIRVLGALLRQ